MTEGTDAQEASIDISAVTTIDGAIDVLKQHYNDQYDIRLVPSVLVLGDSHRCRATIRVNHGEYSSLAETYLEAILDAVSQVLKASR